MFIDNLLSEVDLKHRIDEAKIAFWKWVKVYKSYFKPKNQMKNVTFSTWSRSGNIHHMEAREMWFHRKMLHISWMKKMNNQKKNVMNAKNGNLETDNWKSSHLNDIKMIATCRNANNDKEKDRQLLFCR